MKCRSSLTSPVRGDRRPASPRRACPVLKVPVHPWIVRHLTGVAQRQRMSVDQVVLAAVCEMATRGDEIWAEHYQRAHAGRVAAGLAVALPESWRPYLSRA